VEAGRDQSEAEELVETIDRERIAYVKHYFGADWPTRSLYHLMLNTGMGDANVITTIRNTMQLAEQRSEANDAKLRGVL
jgi:cytidylate kinase